MSGRLSKKESMARPKKNPLVSAAQLPPTHGVDHREPKQRELPDPIDRSALSGMGGEIAEDHFYVRNSRIPNAQSHFPVDPLKRTVDKYFEMAKGGPLYIDEPLTESDIKICQEKAVAMKKENARYAYITRDMDIEDVRKQIDGVA